MHNMTVQEIVSWLESQNTGAKIIYMVYHSAPKCLKKHRLTKLPTPYSQGIMKVQGLTFCLGASYENGVNRQMDKAGADVTAINPIVRVSYVEYFDRLTGRRISEDSELAELEHYLPVSKPYVASREHGERFEAGELWQGFGEHAGPYTVRHRDTGRLYWFGRPAGQGFSWATYALDQTAEITYDGMTVNNLSCKQLMLDSAEAA